MKKILIIFLIVLLLTPLGVIAVSEEPVVGDGFCDRSLGENRENSIDCKPLINDYFVCLINIDDCQDLRTWNEIVLGLTGIIIILAFVIILRRRI